MYLGIDIGTSSVKTVLIDEKQNTLCSASESLSVQRPKPGWSEQQPDDWWQACCKTLDKIQSTYQQALSQVKGIGLSGQMHGATLLDKNNNIIRPSILWNDARAGAECEEIETQCPDSRKISGNIAMAGFTAPKLAWVKKHEPANFERVAKVLLPKDYIRFCLSGEYVSDMSDAAGTLWLDVAKRDWSNELLAATSLDKTHMPRLVEGSEASGLLLDALKQRWGMTEKVVIAGGAGDNAASACGLGTIKAGRAFLSLGTSGVLFVSNARFSPNTHKAVHAFCHALPNQWHQMGVILSATDSLRWLTQITQQTVQELSAQVAKVDSPSDTLFLPYLNGERTPHNDPNAHGAFVGLNHASDTKSLTQAVMEGVAFAFKDCQNALQEAGTDFESALVTGGGTRSTTWLQILATVLDRPLNIPTNSDIGAALGAARLAICAAENAHPDEVCYLPETHATIEPIIKLTESYEAQYERYVDLYPAINR